MATAPDERVTSSEVHFPLPSHQPLHLRQCHDALLQQIRTRDTVTPTIETTSIAVVGTTRPATNATQTVNVNHATGTGTAEDTRSGTHGEVITMPTNSTTMRDEGGTMEMIDSRGKMGTTVMMMVLDGEGTRAVETADTHQADTTKATIKA